MGGNGLPSGTACAIGSVRTIGIATVVSLKGLLVLVCLELLGAHTHATIVGTSPHGAAVVPLAGTSVQFIKIYHFYFPFFYNKKFGLLWLGLVPINIIIPQIRLIFKSILITSTFSRWKDFFGYISTLNSATYNFKINYTVSPFLYHLYLKNNHIPKNSWKTF